MVAHTNYCGSLYIVPFPLLHPGGYRLTLSLEADEERHCIK